MIKKDIEKFFTISNLIENIDDPEETKRNIETYKKLTSKKEKTYKTLMFSFHKSLKHLNPYCAPGILRIYNVRIGETQCPEPNTIEPNLRFLFNLQTHIYGGKIEIDTLKGIIKWHIRFEEIHPFGDGNGRTGRFLMLIQAIKAKIKLPKIFFETKNFEENRQIYYEWFK